MGLNSPSSSGSAGLKRRFFFLSLASVAVFSILCARLWYLQVIKSQDYIELSEKNRTRFIPVEPPRGPIFDRSGELLVENRPAFGISVLRQEVKDPEVLLARLSRLVGVSWQELRRRWELGKRLPRYQPVPLVDDVGREIMERVQENATELPGVIVEVTPVRYYTHGQTGAHLFGYIGEITERELQKERFEGYRSGEMVGKSGLERYLEESLRGAGGERRVEVDAYGRELRQLKGVEPIPGKKVYLTIDTVLQEATEAAFGDAAGAAVTIDVNTGEVLAMVSSPGFDPALFSGGISSKEWAGLVENPLHPLQNRTIQGQYPPGSTFKIVTALAALEAGVANPATYVDCQGSMKLGERDIRCWKKGGHGGTDLHKALRESCDIWFYQVGMRLGIERLAAMAFDLGLGEPLNFPLEGEKKGLIPTKEWKKKRFGVGWFNGETALAAIGQGYVLTTPLQLAVMTAAVANGGTVLQPQVLRRIEDLDGNVELELRPKVLHQPKLNPENLRAVRRGLEAVVNEAGGTAASCRLHEVRVAGKTGTAQVVKNRDANSPPLADLDKYRDHALFVAYAPAERPQIAVAVVAEHGGHGGSAAGPIARAIFASYFGIESELQAFIGPPAPGRGRVAPVVVEEGD